MRLPKNALVPVLVLCVSACATDAVDGKSGETHFLCKTDDDCTRRLGDQYVCSASYCERVSDAGAPSNDGGSAGAPSAGGAFGVGGAPGAGGFTAAAGGIAGATPGAAGVAGAPGIGADGGSGKGGTGGDFLRCEVPPDSKCSAAATCAEVGCPSLWLDEHGCVQPTCDADGDCASDQRCVFHNCDGLPTCMPRADGCVCTTFDDPCVTDSRCAPTTVAGPRGTWVTLDVIRTSGPCPTTDGCTATWHVGPDGHVTGTIDGKPTDIRMNAAKLAKLRDYVDGGSLRTALRDGLPCMNDVVFDTGMTVQLKLSTGTLSKEANGCLATDNVLSDVYDLLSTL